MAKMTMWEFPSSTGAATASDLVAQLTDDKVEFIGMSRRLLPPPSTLESVRQAKDPLTYASVVTGAVVGRLLGWARRIPPLRTGIDGGLTALAEQTVRLGNDDDFHRVALDVSMRDASAIFLLTPDEGGNSHRDDAAQPMPAHRSE